MTKTLSELLNDANAWRRGPYRESTGGARILLAILENLDDDDDDDGPERWVLTFAYDQLNCASDERMGVPGAGVYAAEAEARAQIPARAALSGTDERDYGVRRLTKEDGETWCATCRTPHA